MKTGTRFFMHKGNLSTKIFVSILKPLLQNNNLFSQTAKTNSLKRNVPSPPRYPCEMTGWSICYHNTIYYANITIKGQNNWLAGYNAMQACWHGQLL